MNSVIFIIIILLAHIYVDIFATFMKLFFSQTAQAQHIENVGFSVSKAFLHFSQTILKIDFKLEHEVKFPDHCIIVSNHQSLIDIYLLIYIFSEIHIRFIAKKELTQGVPGVSRFLRFLRNCQINRFTQFRQTAVILKTFAKRCKKYKLSPCIFPEGTRSKDGKLQKFHSGAYRIVQDVLKLPTIVVAIDGGWKISRLLNFFFRSHSSSYQARILTVLPDPKNKYDIIASLNESHDLINEQLSKWRNRKELELC